MERYTRIFPFIGRTVLRPLPCHVAEATERADKQQRGSGQRNVAQIVVSFSRQNEIDFEQAW